MKALSSRLRNLETKSQLPFLALRRRSDETQEQAILRQYPDGAPEAEDYTFITEYILGNDGEIL